MSGASIRLMKQELLFGTRGRIDSKYLRDTSRGFTPPSRCFGVQIVGTFCRTNAVSHRLYNTNKNTHLKGGCYCLVPEAGLTRSILGILLGVSPRRRDASASKLLAQFVEPNAVSRRLYDTNKNTHLRGGCYCLVPEAGLEPARF